MQACLSPLSGKLLLQVIIVKKIWLKQLPSIVVYIIIPATLWPWKCVLLNERLFFWNLNERLSANEEDGFKSR